MRIGIIGYTGFVGTHIRHRVKDPVCFNSKNIHTISGHFDIIYCAGLPAKKWYANQYPEKDYENIALLTRYLEHVETDMFVLISTIDVYDSKFPCQDERGKVKYSDEPYGLHRLKFENFVTSTFRDYLIVRLPALFGFGMKKNVIYDILNDNRVDMINMNSSYQWYPLDHLMNDIEKYTGYGIINLFTEPLSTPDLFHILQCKKGGYWGAQAIMYNQKTCHSNTGYIMRLDDVICDLKRFIRLYTTPKTNLCVSNLCWGNSWEETALEILDMYGIQNVELALTRYGTWHNINTNSVKKIFKNKNIISVQSLFYNLDYNIFSDIEQCYDHFRYLLFQSSLLGVKNVLFGCPKTRSVLKSKKSFAEAQETFVSFFKYVAPLARSYGITLSIEHNARQYGCDFCTTTSDVVDILQKIDMRDTVLMGLDFGNAAMMDEDPIHTLWIGHVQVSTPYMNSLSHCPPEYHKNNRDIIQGYDGIVSMETMELSQREFIKSLELLIEHYGKKNSTIV